MHGLDELVSHYSTPDNISVLISCTCIALAVSGDANFAMAHTGLTLGGFTQPIVTRNLVEMQANVEKGLCQRFLWIAPKPATVSFEQLQQVDQDFSTAVGKCNELRHVNKTK